MSSPLDENDNIEKFMEENYADFIDPKTGELDFTSLAEHCAQELGHDEWLDDETHFVWDAAVEVQGKL